MANGKRNAVDPTSDDVRRADEVIADMALSGQALTPEVSERVLRRMVEMRLEIESGVKHGTPLLDEVDLRVREAALRIWVPRIAEEWLGSSSEPYLDGARPIDVLQRGDVETVLDALAAAEQTAWGG